MEQDVVKKYLISPQKLRNEKIKNYPFWRLDKIYKKKFILLRMEVAFYIYKNIK